jgi:hypothetical protein
MTNLSELLVRLAGHNIQLDATDGRLNVRAPRGRLTPELRAEIAAHRQELLAHLQGECFGESSRLRTLGRLLGGSSEGGKGPMIDARAMARSLSVTFRPLPASGIDPEVGRFRTELAATLTRQGVRVVPWEQATTDFCWGWHLPGLGWQLPLTSRVVKTGINAVIDVERSPSWLRRSGIVAAEGFYTAWANLRKEHDHLSVSRIARLSSWAEDHTVRYVEDPTNTQVITLTPFDSQFCDPDLPYQQKIALGINTLVRTFSEIVIGVAPERISLLNMNLSDSLFERARLDEFVLKSLVPKVYVPIFPLALSRFRIGRFDPTRSPYAQKLADLGREVGRIGLLPPGSKFTDLIRRRSHRDIVHVIVNGRTGVSYGFVAYAEPPRTVGPREVSDEQWQDCTSISGFDPNELRENGAGRWFLKVETDRGVRYRQIPDLHVTSARSGANKSALDPERDIVRLGLTNGRLSLELPEGVDPQRADIKPSYDVYVMFALALAAALHAPHLIENGAALVHFHGFPSDRWFQPGEYWAGTHNPSVPCGTYESGIFNLLGLGDLGRTWGSWLRLACLVEPDHGTNLIAADPEYLVARLKDGWTRGQIALGGRHFASLRAEGAALGGTRDPVA